MTLILVNDGAVLEGQFPTPIDVSFGQLDVKTQGHYLELNPELVLILVLGPKLIQKRLGLVEFAPQGKGDDQVELENGPSRGNRADIFLVRIFTYRFCRLGERTFLDVGRIKVGGSFRNSAELDQGLGCVQVAQRVVTTWLKEKQTLWKYAKI